MKHIKQLLPNMHTISNQNKQWKLMLIQNWESIIGSLASKVSIHKIYNHSITLGVSDSSWMHELYLLSDLIKKKINEALDKPHIQTIRFHYVTTTKKSVQKNQDPVSLPHKEKTLTNKEKKALEEIKDPELVKALTRLLQKCRQ